MTDKVLILHHCRECGNPMLASFTGHEDLMRGKMICHGDSDEPCRPVHHIDLRCIAVEPVTLEPNEFDYLVLLLGEHIIRLGEDHSTFARILASKLIPLMRNRVTLTTETDKEVQS